MFISVGEVYDGRRQACRQGGRDPITGLETLMQGRWVYEYDIEGNVILGRKL